MEQSMNRYIGQMLDDRYEILEIIGSLSLIHISEPTRPY